MTAPAADAPKGRRRASSTNKRQARNAQRRRIIGVDGEGQDVFVCKRCHARVPAVGGPCPAGGEHALTFGCRRCKKLDPTDACEKSEDGAHELRVVADDHIYTYLAAVDEYGLIVSEAYNGEGLTHDECANMLLAIPKHTLSFGFMFSYDVTKIIQELPPKVRYYLMRPTAREMAVCSDKDCKATLPRGAKECHDCGGTKVRKTTAPVDHGGRSYDFFHGSLTVQALVDGRAKSTKIWDCFRFFGVAFVAALQSWSACKQKDCKDADGSPGQHDRVRDGKVDGYRCRVCRNVVPNDGEAPVATAKEIEDIDAMKKKRGAFDVEDPDDVRRYCRNECRLLARMMRKLINAHERAEIPLKRYDGAGSTASALLRKYGVEEFKGPKHGDLDLDLQHAVECAFFGGRFEDSVVGLVEQPVYGYDISSAYPYAETHLPCLQCGLWRFERRMTKAKIADIIKKGGLVLARFFVREVPPKERREIAWCPLPFRSAEGSISYGTNFKGWSWGPEIHAALEGWSDLVRLSGEAWVYELRCDHKPFSFLPQVYRQRTLWGKDGAGVVLKLGMNACVTGDALVRTAHGEERIDTLVGAAVEVVGDDGELHHAGSVHAVGEREVYRLRTRGGRELVLTPDHLVSTENRGDVRAWELVPDDLIATARGTDSLLSFRAAGVAMVYDLTEVDTLHFVANGIIVHNSYGKTAQSIGDNPPFQSWIWAGMTTATTRGQLSQAIASAKDRWNVLAVATDGIFALEELPLGPPPRDTGTDDLSKPLGGWEYKAVPEGIFLAKPGLYYSLEQKFIRARGVGRREVKEFRKLLEDGFARWDRRDPTFNVPLESRRFYGAKHSIYGRSSCKRCVKSWPGVPELRCPGCGQLGESFEVQMIQTEGGRDAYGTWDERTVKIAFDPYPKREREGVSRRGPFAYLTVRDLDGQDSAAYDVGAARTTPEGEAARDAKDFDMEQPDWPQ